MYLADTICAIAGGDTLRIIRSMKTWQSRAQQRMEELGLVQADLIPVLGVTSRGAVGHYLKGRREPSLSQMTSLAQALQMSLDELLSGNTPARGEALEGALQTTRRAGPQPGYQRYATLRDSDLVGGTDISNKYEVIVEIELAEWKLQQELGVVPSPARVKLYTVKGDANAPAIKDGDVVFVDLDDQSLVDGGLFIIVLHGYVLLKRMEIRTDGIHILSFSRPERPDVLPPSDFKNLKVAGRVLGSLQLRGSEFMQRLH